MDGFIGSGSWDGRRANPQHESPSGASGGSGAEPVAVLSKALAEMVHLQPPPPSVPSSFKFPEETLACPACCRCLSTPGTQLWAEDSVQ